jgi:type II secretory pathway pseudopilin PulG
MPRIAIFKQGSGSQRGGVLLVMLVILVIGAAALLVSALNGSSLKIARDKTTADALAQAKDALIAYAASDANRPGELPCPDFNNDGPITLTEDYSGSNCLGLVGWLPWKSLGLPDLRDGNGDRLWYAVAAPFRANAPSTVILNSDTPSAYPTQMLTVLDSATGATLESGVIAIVFSPGAPLNSQTRSPSDNNATNAIPNYLEADNANLNTTFQTSNNNQVPAPTTIVNDRLLTIRSSNLFPPVERRIAREVKACLDNYAAMPVSTNGNAAGLRYPWAAPVGDATSSPGINGNYTGVYGKYFGRVPAQPNIDTSSNPASTLMTALNTLQATEGAFNTSSSSANNTALQNAANTVLNLKNSVSNVSSTTINQAGAYGIYFANGSTSYSTATSYLTSATNALKNSDDLDLSMSISWPATCTILNNPSSYFWTAWKNMVFYQMAKYYQPGSSASFGVPLTINGSGTYRATALIARAAINSTQFSARSSPGTNPPTPYLEGINPHSGSTPTNTFVTYSTSDPNYSTVNDLVLCLDGKGINPGSVCP